MTRWRGMRLRPHVRAHALRAPRWHRSRRFTSLRDDAGLRSLRKNVRKNLPSADGRPSADTAARRWRWDWPSPRRGVSVPTDRGKRGQDTKYGFLSPLDSPYLPLRCDSLRSRSEMRGAHRDVWCSKGTPLMEAELFAAERGRPAPSGRALTALPTTQAKFRQLSCI